MEYIAIDKEIYDHMLCGITKTINEIQSLAEEHCIEKEWIENGELAAMLGLSKRQLQSYRERGVVGFSTIGRKIYYRRTEIAKLIEQNKINTNQYGTITKTRP